MLRKIFLCLASTSAMTSALASQGEVIKCNDLQGRFKGTDVTANLHFKFESDEDGKVTAVSNTEGDPLALLFHARETGYAAFTVEAKMLGLAHELTNKFHVLHGLETGSIEIIDAKYPANTFVGQCDIAQ